MNYFSLPFFKDFDLDIGKLASIAAPEDWNFSNEQSKTNKILKNYLEHTFRKLRTDSKLMYTSDNHFACFNTGLFTLNYESVFYVVFLDKEHRFCPTELK